METVWYKHLLPIYTVNVLYMFIRAQIPWSCGMSQVLT